MEVSVGVTIVWAILRMVATFFHFTPYGNYVFSRPFVGLPSEGTSTGAVIGLIVLFVISFAATLVYAILFARFKLWWGGVLYGAALFLLFGLLFEMWRWKGDTLSTELAWFLTYGLFIGLSLTAERFDEI
ncbi:YqhR family membrane protein [Brevibacillus humidisoli]|uniref:YqhR family membrane protein n=1 Tax=Brevibacillus humidisoli TaxID=2895522 RepID=UPI001E509B1E|nr:YqhR family membrane protein [Brevibacillus humidisoli]UFJ42935.1 YqhR family membrane protein [Brevibacillus humidisoli]